MLALDFIKANRETVERAIRDKNVDLDLDALLTLDGEVRAAKTEIDRLRAERNAVSARFKDAAPEEKAELGRQAKEAGARASELEAELSDKEAALKWLMLKLPGIPYEGAPVGPDESYNKVIRTVGEPPKFDFQPLDHVALIEKNGWGDLSRVTQVSGSRTYCLKGGLALLETKLMGWALSRIAAAGFTPDHRPRDRARAGVPQPGPVSRPSRGDLRASQRRSVARGHRGGRADVAPRRRDRRGGQAADPLRRLLALLPPRGGKRGQGRARAASRPPVREGRAICGVRGRRCAVGRVACDASAAGRGDARRAGNPLPGDRDLDRRHGPRQISHERHRELGADRSASIARRTAARRFTTGRRGARTSATAAPTGRCGSRIRSTIRRSLLHESSCRCSRTIRPPTAA